MVKLKSGRTITIKINGEKRPFLEESAEQHDEQDQEIKAGDNAADGASLKGPDESAASAEPTDSAVERFEWILPEPSESIQVDRIEVNQEFIHKEKKGKASSAFKKLKPKNHQAFKSLLFAVLFAVIVGTSFGILMLKLVVQDHGQQQAVEKPAAPVSAPNGKAVQQAAVVTKPPMNLFVVQKGVFSTGEGAREFSKRLKTNGLPADSLEISGKYYLFLGVTDSMTDAKSLGNYYKQNGTAEVYPKNLSIPEKKLNNIGNDEKAVLESTARIFPVLANAAANGLIKGVIPSETLKAVASKEAGITKIDNKKLQNEKIKVLKKEITAADELIHSFQKNIDKTALIQAQQHLLTFLSVYHSI